MLYDHRRILATAISRLRTKLKYRPVVFELMAHSFTLTELQRCVEAISGRHLHKQNFRRLVEGTELVEPTGETSTATAAAPQPSSASGTRCSRSARRSACASEGAEGVAASRHRHAGRLATASQLVFLSQSGFP